MTWNVRRETDDPTRIVIPLALTEEGRNGVTRDLSFLS